MDKFRGGHFTMRCLRIQYKRRKRKRSSDEILCVMCYIDMLLLMYVYAISLKLQIHMGTRQHDSTYLRNMFYMHILYISYVVCGITLQHVWIFTCMYVYF